MRKKVFSFVVLQLLFMVHLLAQEKSLHSPDGRLDFEIRDGQPDGELIYEIKYNGLPVILPSLLGISNWETDMEIESVSEKSVDNVWHPVYGERAKVKDRYNEKIFVVKTPKRKDRLQIIVRAYDGGIAFRYQYVGNNYLRITSEKTTFRVPQNTYCWFAPYAQAEHKYLPVRDWPGEAERPLTLQLPGKLYAALGEAEMVNYSRTKFFLNKGEENIIRCQMYDAVDEIAPFSSPWRVVMVADQAKDLLANNDIFLNLNKECKIGNTGWIKPGKVMRVTRLSTEAGKEMVDLALKRKLDYIHFDAGWYGPESVKDSDPRKPIGSLDLLEVVRYARSKNIGVWLYVNQRALAEYLDEILPLYQSWGIAGIKFGFVQVGSFRWTTWMHEAVAKCAKYQLMVDIHDEYRPTGFSRTYPNLLTQEGVRGNEEFPDGVNNTTLPFTRFLAGAADATVCYYHRKELKPNLASNPNARSLQNTSCHQMALSVINYSPLQFLYWYDTPSDFKDDPELVFFDELHTVWDDTKILEGSIGKFVSIARRKGNKWFVGSITNNDSRKFEFSFDFLDPDKKYELRLFTDGGEKIKTRTHVAIETKKVTYKSKLKLDLLPRGGCAMIIEEK
jgi:alpha-glucosidase